MEAYDIVKRARSNDRATAGDMLRFVVENFHELHGDRLFGDDSAIIGGVGRIGDLPVTALAIEKGKDINDRMRRNFGMAHPEGYRKSLRLMKQAEKFGRPVVCFVDTFGAYPGISAEERGQGFAISEAIKEMMWLKTPVISIVTGEGGSGGALALSVANEIWMLENSYFSVISPEGCASILWKDAKFAPDAAQNLKLTSADLIELKIADRLIKEDANTVRTLKAELNKKIKELFKLKDVAGERYKKFRKIGY